MSQHAWLDFRGGCWHLMIRNDPVPKRKWKNRRAAFADLAAEGWIIEGAPADLTVAGHDADRHCCCFGLTRTIH